MKYITLTSSALYIMFGLQFISLYLFTKGFFLVRQTLPNISENAYQGEQTSRVILMVVDSLRIDLALLPQFKFIQDQLEYHPDQSLMYLSVADAPTVTNQRIQGITTGNIPSFMNLLANFQATSLQEDNLLWSLNRSNKTTVFSGDDTWTHLFPNSFTREYPEDSFNVKDLNSVDNTVIRQTMLNIDQNWTMMIGHLLGLDHVGHTFDINANKLDGKLVQYSQFLQEIYDKMDEDTVMIVIGDHGMKYTGNHGGDSDEETNTVIFACTKGPKRFYKEFKDQLQEFGEQEDLRWDVKNLIKSTLKYNSSVIDGDRYLRKVSQIDLVSTLSILMGIPIPYNNIGNFIPEFLFIRNDQNLSYNLPINIQDNILEHCFNACIANTEQIWNYIMHIQSLSDKFPTEDIERWNRQLEQIKGIQNKQLFGIIEALSLVYDIQTVARKVWNEYDNRLMEASMVFMFMTFLLALIYIDFISKYSESQFDDSSDSFNVVELYLSRKNRKFQLLFLFILSLMIFFVEINLFLCFLGIFITVLLCCVLQQSKKKLMISNQSIVVYNSLDVSQNQNCTTPFQNSTNSQKYNVVLWIALHIGYCWIAFSLALLKREDYILFKIYFSVFMLYIIYQLICRSINIAWSLVHMATFVLAQQYDKNLLQKYPLSKLRIKSLSYFFHNIWIIFIIPAIFTHVMLNRYLSSHIVQINSKTQQIILRTYLHILLTITQLFFCIQMISPQSEFISFAQIILVPRIVYFFSILGIMLTFYLLRAQSKIIIPILVCMPLYILTDIQSVAVFPIFFLSIYSLIKLFKSTLHMNGLIYFYGCLGIVSSYFWFMMGNRCNIASIKVENAYVGFPQFNLLLTGTLMALGQLSVFMLLMVFLPVIGEALLHKKNNQIIRRQHILMFQTHFLLKLLLTSMNCYRNTFSILLVGDFLPKFIFESFIYLGVTTLSLIIS